MDFNQIIFENGNVCFYFYLILFNFSVVANADNVECRKLLMIYQSSTGSL